MGALSNARAIAYLKTEVMTLNPSLTCSKMQRRIAYRFREVFQAEMRCQYGNPTTELRRTCRADDADVNINNSLTLQISVIRKAFNISVIRKAFDNDGWCLGVALRSAVIDVVNDYIFGAMRQALNLSIARAV